MVVLYIFQLYGPPRVVIEGRVFESVLEAEENLSQRFVWDRLDIYGRKVFGQVTLSLRIFILRYIYSITLMCLVAE